jgi:4-amino-4-deoxy-L-arabinose transferase-like glycosyltransferase
MTSNFLARALERPERALMMLIVAQLAFWTLAPLLSHSAPPLDVVEMQATGREGVIATFKHPNAPGLVLEAARRVTGAAGWPAYIVSQLCIASTFAIVFALGRDLMDARRALMGTLLLTGVYFFSWPTPEFNHNVLQMPFWALTCWALWRGTTQGGTAWWALLGLAGGLSMWAKYSSAILLVVAGAWILYDAQARRKLLTSGPWLALVVCAATFAPQLVWLIDHDFAPFSYAARRAVTATFADTLSFLPLQLAHHLPMLLLMLAAGLFGARAPSAPQPPDKRALAFLLVMGLGPALLLTLVGLVTVSGLRTAWGAPMFNLSGLLAVALLTQRFDEARLRRVFAGAGVLILLTSGLYFGVVRYGYQFSGKPLRTNWPQAEISDTLETAWREETHGAPLRIVAGDIWTAGLINMSGRPPPHVLINGDYVVSPWISPEDVARDGALVVWSGRQPGALAEFAQGLDTRELEVHAPGPAGRRARPMLIHYVVISPAARAN